MGRGEGESVVRRLWRDWGLTIVLLGIFLATLAGQILAGWGVYNEESVNAGRSAIPLVRYVATSHFGEALFEN